MCPEPRTGSLQYCTSMQLKIETHLRWTIDNRPAIAANKIKKQATIDNRLNRHLETHIRPRVAAGEGTQMSIVEWFCHIRYFFRWYLKMWFTYHHYTQIYG